MKNRQLLTLVATALIGAMNALSQPVTTFTKITTGPVVTNLARGWGAAWGDFDNDSFIDLVVANEGADFLYRNNRDGTLIQITSGPVVTNSSDLGAGVAFTDYDNDGNLDLAVGGYGGPPTKLFRNNGDGSFAHLAGNPPNAVGNANSVSWGDYDNDGYPDLMVAMFGQPNLLYRNNRVGSFIKMTSAEVGNILSDQGESATCVWSDYDNDGDLDVLAVNFHAKNAFYCNSGDGTFTRLFAADVGDLDDAESAESNGGAWGDYDNDGDLDVFVARGGAAFLRNDALYRNNGHGAFTKMISDDCHHQILLATLFDDAC